MREQLSHTWHLFTTFGQLLNVACEQKEPRGKCNNRIKLAFESQQIK